MRAVMYQQIALPGTEMIMCKLQNLQHRMKVTLSLFYVSWQRATLNLENISFRDQKMHVLQAKPSKMK